MEKSVLLCVGTFEFESTGSGVQETANRARLEYIYVPNLKEALGEINNQHQTIKCIVLGRPRINIAAKLVETTKKKNMDCIVFGVSNFAATQDDLSEVGCLTCTEQDLNHELPKALQQQ